MPWFRVDDDAHSHPKLLAAGDLAVGLWTRAGSYCAKYLTEGHVSRQTLRQLKGQPRVAQRLVDAGLWVADPDGDGWRFHGWDERQPTREDVERDRAAAAERQRRLRASRRDKPVDRPLPGPVDNSGTGLTRASRGTSLVRPEVPHSRVARASQEDETAGQGVSSRRESRDPGPARPGPTHLLAYLGRLALGDAREEGRPPADQVDAWQAIAGPHVDLLREAATYLARHGGTPAADPHAAWIGWLKAARRRADTQHRPPIGCAGCHGGWLDDDDHGRPRPCPTCRPRRLHAVADAS